MNNRLDAQKKPSSNSAPAQNKLQSRPFAVQAKTEAASPQLQETSEGSGQNLANISIFAPNASPPLQEKLTIGQPGDKYEQEADRVAAQVVSAINNPQGQPLQRKLISEISQQEPQELPYQQQSNKLLQRKSTGEKSTVTPELESTINRSRNQGHSLPNVLRKKIEGAIGADFSKVKIHTDVQSDRLNQSLQAKAFTTGHDIFFRQGAYEPNSKLGQELLVHELTHVVQQNGAKVSPSIQRVVLSEDREPLNVSKHLKTQGFQMRGRKASTTKTSLLSLAEDSCPDVAWPMWDAETRNKVSGNNFNLGDYKNIKAFTEKMLIEKGKNLSMEELQKEMKKTKDFFTALDDCLDEQSKQVLKKAPSGKYKSHADPSIDITNEQGALTVLKIGEGEGHSMIYIEYLDNGIPKTLSTDLGYDRDGNVVIHLAENLQKLAEPTIVLDEKTNELKFRGDLLDKYLTKANMKKVYKVTSNQIKNAWKKAQEVKAKEKEYTYTLTGTRIDVEQTASKNKLLKYKPKFVNKSKVVNCARYANKILVAAGLPSINAHIAYKPSDLVK